MANAEEKSEYRRFNYQRLRQGMVEYFTAAIDSVKHLTTLSAGAIVLIATFLSDVFTRRDLAYSWMGVSINTLIILSLLSFGISLGASLWLIWKYRVVIFRVTKNLERPLKGKPIWYSRERELNTHIDVLNYLTKYPDYVRRVLVWLSPISFLLGLAFFGLAAYINLSHATT
jgi:hypothetical protein